MAFDLELKNSTHGKLAHEIQPRSPRTSISDVRSARRVRLPFDTSIHRITLVSGSEFLGVRGPVFDIGPRTFLPPAN